ncbi:metalloregulator ArsR/SmtB family transcription factor [Dactylosporangium sp. NPDC049525]|uniref:metalloregulator ArsR/SmtB family transcription factor n=1 Tax=Dactylosporangium sp. NPDC049525 TaxID=3154730 RepID=UPI0034281399
MDDVAEAIADPARREILVLLRGGPRSAGHIAAQIGDRFGISRPAVSRHLRVLRECGLVRDTLQGRHRHYDLDATRLGELTGWLAQFAAPSIWEQRMDALETEVHRTRRDRRHAAVPTAEENIA